MNVNPTTSFNESEQNENHEECSDSLNSPILACSHTSMIAHPDHTFQGTLMGQGTIVTQKIRLCIRSVEVKYADFLLLPAREQVGRLWGQRDTADDVIMGEGMETVARICIPDFPRLTAN